MTAGVLNFIGAWNDFVTPLYMLSRRSMWPMVLSIYNFFGEHFNEWNLISANIIMCVVPIIILYIAGQRYIVSGMTSGSVKQ
jgi:raffinose/stachyose/melibiose transport system permease protein